MSYSRMFAQARDVQHTQESIETLLGIPEHKSEDVMDQEDTISLQELSRRERRRG